MSLALVALAIFQTKSCVFAWGEPWTTIILPLPSSKAGITGCTPPCPVLFSVFCFFFFEMGISLTFCLDWPQKTILLIAIFRVAGIKKYLISFQFVRL
jgi:hypothetical protein